MNDAQRHVSIYCSGGIRKGPADDAKLTWGDLEREALAEPLKPVEVVFLNPDERTDDLTDAFTVFGRDHFQVQVADVCVVDARQRRGIGVGIEMLSAKQFGKPIVSIAPPNSHYRRHQLSYLGGHVEDYVHAHLFGLSDAIVDDFREAGIWIASYLEGDVSVKGTSIVLEAIEAYRTRQLHRDIPMRKILERIQTAE
jgi:hypothetical protein